MIADTQPKALVRVPSGIRGFDKILSGGFLRGGVYMILGKPGAGKTILGNQTCYNHVAAGGRALFLTLLSESHARMISYIGQMAFFDRSQIGSSLVYVSGYQALENEGLKGLLGMVRKCVMDHHATLLVIDGLVTAGTLASSEVELKKFIHELQLTVELVGCTTLLLTGESNGGEAYPLRTMVDGLVQITFDPIGMGTARTLEVTKHRGSDFLMGRHLYQISDQGIGVHPRTESVLGRNPARPRPAEPLAFGIESLDPMLGGGLEEGSVTLELGAPGTGKTLLGLGFLAEGARRGQPGLYFGFSETPDELKRRADSVGLGLSSLVDKKAVELRWQPPLGLLADVLAEELLERIEARGVRRLFIDGIDGLVSSLVYPDRAGGYFTALGNELRSRGVTTLFSDETSSLFGPEVTVPVSGLNAALDNILFLRHVELRAQLHRLISVVKMRGGPSDSSLREFSITDRGIEVSSSFDSAEAIVTGIARSTSQAPPRKASASPRHKKPSRRRSKK
ncbi:MAG: RAD55 family ATPase [Polyangia bacterium]